jgi:hypothetical protein
MPEKGEARLSHKTRAALRESGDDVWPVQPCRGFAASGWLPQLENWGFEI